MKTILYINACMRGEEVSRTGRLARAFLEACRKRNPDLMIKERNVLDSALPVLTGALAEKRVYITTAGGIIGNQNYGYEYIRGLGGMFGIHDSAWLSAEGLDIQENDPEEIMREAEKEAARLADMYLNGSTGVNPEQEKTWPIS